MCRRPVTLNASGALSYTWTPGNLNGASITVTPNVPTAYQVIGSNSLGCTGVANAAVIVQPSPTLNLSANNNFICAGDPVDITVSGANSYTWNNGFNTTSVNVTPPNTTVYSVIGEVNGCTSTSSITFTFSFQHYQSLVTQLFVLDRWQPLRPVVLTTIIGIMV